MKDQLKKTFSDALRQVQTTTEDITKTKETFPTEKVNYGNPARQITIKIFARQITIKI